MSSRVLIVDDDVVVRESLIDDLRGTYDVHAVACGRDALAELNHNRYDAIISDLRMPDHDGIAVLEHAFRCDPEMVRILLTGYLDDHAHHAVLRPNAPFKVGKPWHDELEVVLRRAFEHRDERRRLTDAVVETRGHMNSMVRSAAVGTMSAALLHEVASLVQIFDGASYELSQRGSPRHDEASVEMALEDAALAGRQLVRLCVAMRDFMRTGEVVPRNTPLPALVQTAVALCRSYVRRHASLEIAQLPEVSVRGSEPLLLQVLVTLLRNVADGSPPGSRLRLAVTVEGGRIAVTINDATVELGREPADALPEELLTADDDRGGGVELAAAASIVAGHGGTLRYRPGSGRATGSFTVSLAAVG